MVRLKLEELALVRHLPDQLVHVVGLVGAVRDQRVEAHLQALGVVLGGTERRRLAVVQRQEIEERAGAQQRVDVVLHRKIGDAGLGGVRDRAAKLVLRHHLVGDGLHHLRAGDEHVGRILDHEDEVGHRRAVDRAARARPHDEADLRDDSAREYVPLEHLGVAAERGDALLNAGAARIVEADDGRADLHRHVHHLADFLRMALRKRAAEHGEVLAEHVDEAAVDGARSGDDAVAGNGLLGHAEIDAVVLDVHVELFEAARIEQDFETLAGGEAALGVLRVDADLSAAQLRGIAAAFEFGKHLLHRQVPRSVCRFVTALSGVARRCHARGECGRLVNVGRGPCPGRRNMGRIYGQTACR
nr:B292 [uncultured bacterium]